jgi:hypothetical protein
MSNVYIQVFDHLDSAAMVDGRWQLRFQCVRCNHPCNYAWIDKHGNPITEGDRLIPIAEISTVVAAHDRLHHKQEC